MAEIKVIKINSDGFSEEHGASDDLTMATLTGATQVGVTGGVTITSDIAFNTPLSDTINGIIADNLLDSSANETITGTYSIDTGAKLVLSDAPTLSLHATNKEYVDQLAQGNKRKDAVVVATTANITLSGEQTIDGVLTSVSRVLVKDQTNQTENGIYVSAAGAWTRTADADTGAEILAAITKVLQGTTNIDRNFQNTNSTEPTIGATNITFTDLGSSSTHNSLAGLQGGNGSTEYYHMTAAEDTWLNTVSTEVAAANVLDKTAAETISGVYTFTDDVNIAAGALEIPTAIDASPVTGGVYMDAGAQKVYGYDGATYFDIGGSGTATSVTSTYTAGAGGIAQYDAVYISENDTVLKAAAGTTAPSRLIGFAPAAITAAASGSIQEDGVLAGILTGATAGDAYYLDTTAGTISTTVPTGGGSYVVRVGYAKNATDLHIQIQQVGRRAA
jgi:hypothetical protein